MTGSNPDATIKRTPLSSLTVHRQPALGNVEGMSIELMIDGRKTVAVNLDLIQSRALRDWISNDVLKRQRKTPRR